MPKRKASVGQYIATLQEQDLAEFGRLGLPPEVKARARNLACDTSVSVKEALATLIGKAGSLEVLAKECKQDSRKLRKASKRVASRQESTPNGVFGSKTVTPGAPPLQGGAIGLGRRSGPN